MATRKAKRDFIQHHHLLMRMELVHCPERKDIPAVKRMVTNILKALNMHSLAPPRVYYLDKPENNRGMTCIAPIKTSHIAFHFWSNPDPSVFQNVESRCLLEFDIYTCGSMTPSAVKDILHQLAPFRPTRADIDIFNRRTGLVLEHHFSWDNSKRPEWDEWLDSKAFLDTRRNRERQSNRPKQRTRKSKMNVIRTTGGGKRFDVYFGDTPVVGQLFTRAQTGRRPIVNFDIDNGEEYVVVMYDNDAPDPAHLHWMISYSVVRGQLVTDTVAVYMPPSPPKGETHTYTIDFLRKIVPIGRPVVRNEPNSRIGFSVHDFAVKNNLYTIGRTQFRCS